MSKLIVANWKSNKQAAAVAEWYAAFHAATPDLSTNTVVIAPPLPYLTLAQEQHVGTALALGAQNVSSFPFGSYTGEVTAAQLKDCGVQYVIVGHSERRRYLGETDKQVAQKVSQLLQQGLTPLLCVDTPYLESQSRVLAADELAQCVVVYEPVAAIGTGRPATVGDIEQVGAEIKQLCGQVPVLYGGSVTEQDVREFLLVTDGVLVGGASLDAKQFAALVTAAVAH